MFLVSESKSYRVSRKIAQPRLGIEPAISVFLELTALYRLSYMVKSGTIKMLSVCLHIFIFINVVCCVGRVEINRNIKRLVYCRYGW